MGIDEQKMWDEINKLKKQIGTDLPPKKQEKPFTYKLETYQLPHRPINMVDFLYKFSLDEKFKWFTHDPDKDMVFNYQEYLSDAKKEYPKIAATINAKTWGNVQNFIFKTEYPYKMYDNNIIEKSWRNVEDWCNTNPNKHPFEAIISDVPFSKYINQFKNTIEFRTDNNQNNFKTRFKQFVKNKVGVDFQDELIFSDSFNKIGSSLHTYIDVRLFFEAIAQLLKWIEENKSKSNRVELNLKSLKDCYLLEIFHKDSYFSCDPDDEKLKGLSGDFEKTRQNLFCVADWRIQATIRHGNISDNYRIICLDNNTVLTVSQRAANTKDRKLNENSIEKMDKETKGIKHIIKLYKNVTQ
jgi:hypothetical protein